MRLYDGSWTGKMVLGIDRIITDSGFMKIFRGGYPRELVAEFLE
jgi:hypothetical protein